MKRLLLVALVVPMFAMLPASAQEKGPTPDEAWQRLKEGNARFVAEKPQVKDLGDKRRLELAQKQRPFAVVLSCADSRVIPEVSFDQGLGDLFVLRVAGNVAGPEVFASMEYAVSVLKSPLIAVVGHTSCGAVEAALSGKELPSTDLTRLIDLVYFGEGLPKDKKAALDTAVRNNVLYHAADLTRQSKILKDFAGSGRIKIVAGVYGLKSGVVDWLEMPKK